MFTIFRPESIQSNKLGSLRPYLTASASDLVMVVMMGVVGAMLICLGIYPNVYPTMV